jgi:cytoskeleton protein RodZ
MKVPVKKLEALEADRLDLLPDAVFVRALASSVCRALKIDPAPVLQRLPQTAVPRLDAERRGINEPFHGSGHSSQFSMPAFLARPAVWVVAILLAGAAVLIIFPEVQRMEKDTDTSSVSGNSLAMPSQTVMAAEPVEAKDAVPIIDAQVPSTPASTAINPTPVAAQVAAPAPTASKPVAAAAIVQPAKLDTSAPTVNLAGTASGLVMFKVSGTSWVEVTDAKGVVQLRKTMAMGETTAASGALPLVVVIGRADVTQVEVRGKPFSLAGIAKDNVARFEVK